MAGQVAAGGVVHLQRREPIAAQRSALGVAHAAGSQGIDGLTSFHMLGQSLPTESAGGGEIVWGIGPTFQFPTASKHDLGSGRYAMVPS